LSRRRTLTSLRSTDHLFKGSEDILTTQMKSVGEVMAIGRTFKESLQKAIRSLEIDSYGLLRKAALFFQMADNPFAAAAVRKVVREFKPHVAHIHNTLPLLSPSIYAPLAKAGISIFVLSSYSTDHILIKKKDMARALAQLQKLGFIVVDSEA
jgi:hypothetical protein